MSILKMYFASNDQLVSEAPTTTHAVSFTLRADQNEQQAVRLYAMTDAGYESTTTTVAIQGTSAAKWAIAPDNAGTAGTYQTTALSLATVGNGAGKKFFWARASATDDEAIGVDTSVTLKLEGIGAAV